MKELITIQSELKAPKGQFNNFNNYYYRSAEDILEAVKPLLAKTECTLVLSDDIFVIGERVYVKTTATIKNGKGECESTTSYAREPLNKKGMDDSQATGMASSYARKYALNGLFCIDDTKDADYLNNSKEFTEKAKTIVTTPLLNNADEVKKKIGEAQKESELTALFKSITKELQEQLKPLFTEKKNLIKNQLKDK